MERPAPCLRVNFSLMEKYTGQHVLLVCKVIFPPFWIILQQWAHGQFRVRRCMQRTKAFPGKTVCLTMVH